MTIVDTVRQHSETMFEMYLEVKSRHPGVLILFRMGDFYEAFNDDAILTSKVVGLTLTKRNKTVPMTGFPFHQLDGYLQKLIKEGIRVGIVEADGNEFTNRKTEPVVNGCNDGNRRAAHEAGPLFA